MDPAEDLTPEIDSFIADSSYMQFKLFAPLVEHAAQQALLALRAKEQHTDIPAHQAFQLIITTTHEAAKQALKTPIDESSTLTNALKTHAPDPEQWLDQAVQRPAEAAIDVLRSEFTQRYGFPIITPHAITQLADTLKGHKVLEVGAGNGYLSKQLQDAGVDLFPTDLNPLCNSGYGLGQHRHTNITEMDATTAIQEFPHMDLLWSWPPLHINSGLALREFQSELLVYLGEQKQGCTGGDLFHQTLKERFRLVHSITIPSFPRIHDSIGIYRRKRTRQHARPL